MDKVERFGEIAHNIIPRIEGAFHVLKDMERVLTFLTAKADADLGSLERLNKKGFGLKYAIDSLANLVEVGMCGYQLTEKAAPSVNHLANLMTDTYRRKNADYGDSFSQSCDRFGHVAALVRMNDKVNRLSSLVTHQREAQVKDESIADTFLDLACYAIMTLMWIIEKEEDAK